MKRWKRQARRQAGITLIEMLVVVTIIALFAALVAPRMLGRAEAARVTQARAQINSFMTALGAYKLDTGVYPATEQGLRVLRVRPAAHQVISRLTTTNSTNVEAATRLMPVSGPEGSAAP